MARSGRPKTRGIGGSDLSWRDPFVAKPLGPVDLRPPQARGAKAGGAPSAAARLAEALEKQPELSAYKYPASAGDMDALGKKLDGIAASLKEISGLLARLVQNGGGRWR